MNFFTPQNTLEYPRYTPDIPLYTSDISYSYTGIGIRYIGGIGIRYTGIPVYGQVENDIHIPVPSIRKYTAGTAQKSRLPVAVEFTVYRLCLPSLICMKYCPVAYDVPGAVDTAASTSDV